MNSSIRIDYDRRSKNISQIKVTYRNSSTPNEDIDPRDKMVRDFLYPNDDGELGLFYLLKDHTLLLDGITAVIEPVETNEVPKLVKQPIGKTRTIRDFFELDLEQEPRMKAFDYTAKNRLDLEACSLSEAILQSFYISDTKEGAEYWQDIMVNSIK